VLLLGDLPIGLLINRRAVRFRQPPYVAAGLGPSHHLTACFSVRQSAYGL
jgi:hypothetical protein